MGDFLPCERCEAAFLVPEYTKCVYCGWPEEHERCICGELHDKDNPPKESCTEMVEAKEREEQG